MGIHYEDYIAFLEKVLRQRLISAVIVGILVLIAVIWVFVRKESAGIKAIFISFEIVLFIGALVCILPYALDVSQEAFVTYTGNYTVCDVVIEKGSGYFAVIQLDGDETIKLSLKACEEEPQIGEYKGSLVYSENTRLLFDWEA